MFISYICVFHIYVIYDVRNITAVIININIHPNKIQDILVSLSLYFHLMLLNILYIMFFVLIFQ